MHVKRELCVSVCVSRNLKPSDKKKSGLHIEVPSVYNWQLHVAAHWADKQTAASLGGRQNPVKRGAGCCYKFCVFN